MNCRDIRPVNSCRLNHAESIAAEIDRGSHGKFWEKRVWTSTYLTQVSYGRHFESIINQKFETAEQFGLIRFVEKEFFFQMVFSEIGVAMENFEII